MLLQLINVAEGEISADIICDLDANLESIFPKIIERYKNSIKEAKLSKRIDFTSLHLPSKPLSQHLGNNGRLKPTVEKQRNSCHAISNSTSNRNIRPHSILCSTNKSPQRYKFCKSEDYIVSNCPLKESYGPALKGRDVVGFLLTKAPFSLLHIIYRDKIISTDICAKNGSKHIVIHTLNCKVLIPCLTRPSKEEMVVTITLLNDFGTPIPGYTRCLVDMNLVLDYIYKHNETAKKFVFSKLEEESFGGTFCSISNIHQHSNLSQNNLDIRKSQRPLSIMDSSQTSETSVAKINLPTLPPMDLELMENFKH